VGLDRRAQPIEHVGGLDAIGELGGIDAGAAGALAQRFGEHRLDLEERGAGGKGEALAAEGAGEAGADDEGLELLDGEHQRRHLGALRST
jgi:hypothetical protein